MSQDQDVDINYQIFYANRPECLCLGIIIFGSFGEGENMVAAVEMMHNNQVQVKSTWLCTSFGSRRTDPRNSVRAAKAMGGSHFEEVRLMVDSYLRSKEICTEGKYLTITGTIVVAQISQVKEKSNVAAAKSRVNES